MKNFFVFLTLLPHFLVNESAANSSHPDSAYIFAYSSGKNEHHNGLHFAWSIDKKQWQSIGPEYSFLRSDYGQWGSQKKMIDPFLLLGSDGVWHCIWSLNDKDGAFAHAQSDDLVYWGRQSYPLVMPGGNCLAPEISFDRSTGEYTVAWRSDQHVPNAYSVQTKDFKEYNTARAWTGAIHMKNEVRVAGAKQSGTIHKVAWKTLAKLLDAHKLKVLKDKQNRESASEDPIRFASLKPLEGKLTITERDPRAISDLLLGIFLKTSTMLLTADYTRN